MIDPQMEEIVALHALGLTDDASADAFRNQAGSDPELQALVRGYRESVACLAYDAPQHAPPTSLRHEIMRRVSEPAASPKMIAFPQWIPYALAACLMGLAIFQANEIFTLSRQVGAEHAGAVALQQRNYMTELRLASLEASLEAKSAGYLSAKVMVAWDPDNHNGVVSIQNLPPAPAGRDYQLWVLDPKAAAPISAGLLKVDTGNQGFAVHPLQSPGPGFAISLEPAGGRPAPTGTILFAIAPGP